MLDTSAAIGYAILGLAVLAIGFLPTLWAMYKRNNNASQIYKVNPVIILVPGVLGLAIALIFQPDEKKALWALIVLIVLEVIRLAAWVYLMIMTVKDKPLPMFPEEE